MMVTPGKVYRFKPCVIDLLDPPAYVKKGDLVRVKNLHGCPPANTMNHCHVVDPTTDKFIGLVCTSSLVEVEE